MLNGNTSDDFAAGVTSDGARCYAFTTPTHVAPILAASSLLFLPPVEWIRGTVVARSSGLRWRGPRFSRANCKTKWSGGLFSRAPARFKSDLWQTDRQPLLGASSGSAVDARGARSTGVFLFQGDDHEKREGRIATGHPLQAFPGGVDILSFTIIKRSMANMLFTARIRRVIDLRLLEF